MGKYVDEVIAKNAYNTGRKIGETEPSKETKGSWWEVFYIPGNGIVACVMTAWGVSCGERVQKEELSLYCDDPAKAKNLLRCELCADFDVVICCINGCHEYAPNVEVQPPAASGASLSNAGLGSAKGK